MFNYESNKNIDWLVGETTDWIKGENTRLLTKQEYDEFINNLAEADKSGVYLYLKPSYVYKEIKKWPSKSYCILKTKTVAFFNKSVALII